jgi:methyl-accepting chemotaxis protein
MLSRRAELSSLRHQAKNHFRLTLCKVLDMFLLDTPSLSTFSNKLLFDEVRPLTFDVSSAFEDASLLTFDVSSAFEDVSLAFEDVSLAFEDVSLLTFDVSSAFEDMSSAFEDLSARIPLACSFIIPSNSCRSLSILLSCGAAASGSKLVSVRRPIPCGFEGTG